MKRVNIVGALVIALFFGAGLYVLRNAARIAEGRQRRAGRTMQDRMERAMGSSGYRHPGRWVSQKIEDGCSRLSKVRN